MKLSNGCADWRTPDYQHNTITMYNPHLKVLTIAALILPEVLSAYDFKESDICYTIIGTESVEVAPTDGSYSGEITIPQEVTHDNVTYRVTAIGAEAFNFCFGVTKISLPESITDIKNNAFSYCSGLTEINLPAGVTSIGERAFSMCSKVTEFKLPSSLKTIGPSAFISCKGNKAIEIPDNVTTIGDRAFYSNTAATTLTIGSGLDEIPDYAFWGCSSLTEVTVPEGIESIGKYSLGACSSLKKLSLPQSLRSIDNYAANANPLLSEISFPDNVELVGRRIFEKSAWEESRDNGLILINGYVAYWQKGDLPEGSSVTLPDQVRVLAGSAYEQQVKLTSITLPERLVSIGDYALYYCNSLKDITVPDNVVSIGDNAMQYCISLKNISLGRTLKNIGNLAFAGGVTPTEIKSYNPVPPTVTDVKAFDIDVYDAAKLIIPQGAETAYSNAPVWEEFTKVEATLPDASGIVSPETNGNEITVNPDGTISTDSDDIKVYDTTGRLISSGTSVRLTHPGIYIITVGNSTQKVIFK